MKIKTYIFVAFSVAFCLSSFTYGGECSDKAILNSRNRILNSSYGDLKRAFSHEASCMSLKSGDNKICCYIKNKFKNEVSDEKYTHKGCIEVTAKQYSEIKGFISTLESSVNNQTNISKSHISIDCSSKYLKLFGLLLFTLIL